MTSVTRLTSKIKGIGLVERAGAAGSAAEQSSTTASKLGLRSSVALLALVCTGCPVGAALDTPYEEYAPPAGGTITSGPVTGVGGATATATSTTGAATCGDAEVDQIFYYKCSSSLCHGDPGDVNPTLTSGLFLFSPTRKTDMLDRPGGVTSANDCSAEFVISTANPSASLMITTVSRTAACGLQMPVGPKIAQAEIDCITQWVTGVATGAL